MGTDVPPRTPNAKNRITSPISNRAVGGMMRRKITVCGRDLVDQTTRDTGIGIGSTSETIMMMTGGTRVGGETLLRDGVVVTRIETARGREKGIEITTARLTSPVLETVDKTGAAPRPQTRTRTQDRR